MTTCIAWVTRAGKNFIDVSFMFNKPFNDDINEEVKRFMQLAIEENERSTVSDKSKLLVSL